MAALTGYGRSCCANSGGLVYKRVCVCVCVCVQSASVWERRRTDGRPWVCCMHVGALCACVRGVG
jgi:hypothetical protein